MGRVVGRVRGRWVRSCCETVYLNKIEVIATELHYTSPREVLNIALRNGGTLD